MPHISAKKLDKNISNKLWNQLLQTFKDARTRNATRTIMGELFTPTERIMFAKRLMIIILLDKGVPQHIIAKELHVSPSTINRLSMSIDRGKYREILRISGKSGILDILEKIILMGMPPRVGRGRWSHWGRFTP
ncbi:MAG: Trp family transcriptional regulator [Parcubacteria group bacterium]